MHSRPTAPQRRLRLLTGLLGLALAARSLPAADQTATWNGTTGNWSSFTNWSTNPLFPNNGNGGFTFDAIQNGGTLTVDQAIAIEKLTLSGGANTGAGFTLTTNDLFTWNAGTLNGTGTLQADGGVAFSTAGFKDINLGRVLNLGGNSTWTGGQIRMGNGAIITNQAGFTFDTDFDGNMGNDFGGTVTFDNHGTFTKSAGAGITTISSFGTVAFNNTGIVNANSGTLRLSGPGTHTGAFNADAGATMNFNGGTHAIDAGASFAGAGTTSITGATFNVNASVGVASSFLLSSGTIGGTGTLTLSGPATFSAGTMTGAGITQANDGLSFSGAGIKAINFGRVLNLGGNSTWTAGHIQMGNGSTITNQIGSTFETSFDGTMGNDFGGAASTFNNAGTFTKSAGAGATTISSFGTVAFNNTGIVNANSGTLSFNGGGTSTGSFNALVGAKVNFGGGTHDLNAGTTITAAGTVGFSGGTTNFNAGSYFVAGDTLINGGAANFNAAASTGQLTLSSGTLGGTDTLTVSGLTTFSAGAMNGAGITQANGGVSFSGAGFKDINLGRVLNLGGNSTWTAGQIRMGNGAIITNQAGFTFDTSFDGTMSQDFGGAATFNNAGTFTKSAGAGITTLASGVTFNNATGFVNANSGTLRLSGPGTHTGNFNTGAGATLNFNSSTHNLNGGSFFTGSTTGIVSVTGATFNVNASVGVAPSFLLSAGTVGGTGTLTLLGPATFSTGTMTGAGITQVNGGMSFSGAGAKDFNLGRTLNLGSNSTWTAGQIRTGGGAILNNQVGSTFDTNFDGNMSNDFSGAATFNNAGTFTKSAGVGTTAISSIGTLAFNNTGAVNANSGTLSLNGGGTSTGSFNAAAGAKLNFGGGTHNLNASSAITAAGTVGISSGTLNMLGTYNVAGTTEISAGTANFNAASASSTAILTWTGGAISGSTGLTVANTLTLSGAGNKQLGVTAGQSATLTNNGTANLSVGHLMLVTTGVGAQGVFVNNGTFNATDNADVILGSVAAGGTPTFNNTATGIFNKSGAATTTTIAGGVTFTNTGTVNVNSGTLELSGPVTQHTGTTLTGGTWNVTNGASINITTGSNITTIGSGGSVMLGGAGSSFTKLTTALNNNQGSFTLKNDRDLTTAGAYTNSGITRVEDSTTTLTVNGAYTQTAGSTIITGGAVIAGTAFNLDGGELKGTGTIQSSVIAGPGSNTIAPGLSPGALTISGDLTLSSGSTLSMEIGGLSQGSLYDFLDVNGTLTLAGMLDLNFINDFQNSVTALDTFTLATANTDITGSFLNIASGNRFVMGTFGSFEVWYGTGSAFGANNLVLSSFGAVPEPSRALLVMLGFFGLAARRRRCAS